jgi:hypothetical protein
MRKRETMERREARKARTTQRKQARNAKQQNLLNANQGWQQMVDNGFHVETGSYLGWVKVEDAA